MGIKDGRALQEGSCDNGVKCCSRIKYRKNRGTRAGPCDLCAVDINGYVGYEKLEHAFGQSCLSNSKLVLVIHGALASCACVFTFPWKGMISPDKGGAIHFSSSFTHSSFWYPTEKRMFAY